MEEDEVRGWGWGASLSRRLSSVTGCWIGFLILVVGYVGWGAWGRVSRNAWEANAEYILRAEMTGRLEDAVTSGKIHRVTADRVIEMRKENGPIKWYKIVGAFGYPKGLGHGGVDVLVFRGENLFDGEIQSIDDKILHWGESVVPTGESVP